MELRELLKDIEIVKIFGEENKLISDIKNNSNYVEPNDLFIAIKGNIKDGHSFINNAIKNGSKTIICQKIPNEIKKDITYVAVKKLV